LQLGPAARAGERQSGGEQTIERRLIESVALALPGYGLIPLEAERAEGLDDLLCAAGDFARRIEIFDSEQPLAAGATRIEIAGGRCDERPEVQRAGGRRSETTSVARERERSSPRKRGPMLL
jgi:hypothetical protein